MRKQAAEGRESRRNPGQGRYRHSVQCPCVLRVMSPVLYASLLGCQEQNPSWRFQAKTSSLIMKDPSDLPPDSAEISGKPQEERLFLLCSACKVSNGKRKATGRVPRRKKARPHLTVSVTGTSRGGDSCWAAAKGLLLGDQDGPLWFYHHMWDTEDSTKGEDMTTGQESPRLCLSPSRVLSPDVKSCCTGLNV